MMPEKIWTGNTRSILQIMKDITTMTDSAAIVSDQIDPSPLFCERTFFQKIREEGCNPIARDGGLYIDFINSAAVRDAGRWAALHDPDGALRLEYARAAWEDRRTDDEVILLGAETV
jgi:hypothetical protein